MRTDRALAAQQWLPIVVEIFVIHSDRDRGTVDLDKAGVGKQIRQPAGNGERGREQPVASMAGLRIETRGRVPEDALIDKTAAKSQTAATTLPPRRVTRRISLTAASAFGMKLRTSCAAVPKNMPELN